MEKRNTFKLAENLSITGLTILILGFVTFTPEIFFPGLVVLLFSGVKGVEALERQRILENPIETPIQPIPVEMNTSYYTW
jgi:hypothetical protein